MLLAMAEAILNVLFVAEVVGYTALTESATDVGPRALRAALHAAEAASRPHRYNKKSRAMLDFFVVLRATTNPMSKADTSLGINTYFNKSILS